MLATGSEEDRRDGTDRTLRPRSPRSGMHPNMKIRDVFSTNLRRHCAPRGTQTKLSADTGISAVQISRYLNGTIPSDKNLELIADYFRIEEHELFEIEGSGRISDGSRHMYEKALSSSDKHAIGPGYYSVLFPNPNRSDIAVRSPLIVKERSGSLEFRRYTGLYYISRRTNRSLWSIHQGNLVMKSESLYLPGYNKLPGHEPSLICLKRLPTEAFAMIGYALVIVSRLPTSIPCALVHAEHVSCVRHHILQDTSIALSEYELGGLFQKIFEVPGRIEGIFSI